MKKKWINTHVIFEFKDGEFIEVYKEGYLYSGPIAWAEHLNPSTDQEIYRWRDDDGTDETDGTWLELANTSHDFDVSSGNVRARLRVSVAENGGADEVSRTYPLEFNINNTTWNTLGAATTGCIYFDSTKLTNTNNTTEQLAGPGTFQSSNGGQCEDGTVDAFVLTANSDVEFEYTIEFVASQLSNGDSIDFRVATLDAYAVTANATITKGASQITKTPPNGNLTLSSNAPTDFLKLNEPVPNGALNLTGITPLRKVTVYEPIPSSRLTFEPVGLVSVPEHLLRFTSFAPNTSVAANVNEPVPGSNLTLTSFAPNATATSNVNEPVPSNTLVLTGIAPNTQQTHYEPISFGSLNLSGFAPNDFSRLYEPVSNSILSLTGFAPLASVTSAVTIQVPSGKLSFEPIGNISVPEHLLRLTSFAPTVTVTAGAEQIPSGTLTLTSYAPLVSSGTVTKQIPSSNIALTSFAPLLGAINKAVPSASLTLTSFAPSYENAPFGTIRVENGSLTLTGIAPYPYEKNLIGDGYLVLTAFAPTITQTGAITKSVPNASIVLTAYSPDAGSNKWELINNGSLSLTGFAPTVSIQTTEVIPSTSLTLTSFAPNTSQTQRESIDSSNLTLTGVAPNTYQNGTLVEQVPPGYLKLVSFNPSIPSTREEKKKAGGGRRARPKIVQINGQRYKVNSYTELRRLLEIQLRTQEAELRLEENLKPKSKKVIKLKASIRRTETRLAKADEAWKIEEENELLLMMLGT